ncbi:hypothetical protein OVS_02250 [Mycoplasma ovis str. Michigan]|uniref:Type I restriction modification DNA specificity domain-containing protein n=1 Tax=Mycoplasma ovis str. Michigan TaxID=1415773 RepID=A0ABN4BKW1_9MOLU|nr:restriction endonuclease subunit S [Mycoplasma ovis]AHC39945.1 hypothetical protein OVS_02250 [Mycoplasma ovis str. Michigan]
MEQTKRLPIGLYKEGCLWVVSSRYRVFEVTNPNLLSEYLKLIFKKELTELWLLYMCFGGIRGELSWKDFVKFPISVTPLEAQKKVVNKYETLERVIQLRKKINKNLERWIQCLFHIIFDNLEEFTNEAFGSLFQISKGGRPPRSSKYLEELYFCQEGGIPFLQVKDISKSKCKFLTFTSEQLTEEDFNKCRGIFLGGGTSFFVITELKKQLKI